MHAKSAHCGSAQRRPAEATRGLPFHADPTAPDRSLPLVAHPPAGPKTERDKEAAALPINCRYSRDIGVLQLTVFLVVLSYGSEWLLRSNVWEGCRPWPSAVH